MNDIILFLGVVLLSASQTSASCFESAPIPTPPSGEGNVEPAVCTYNGQTYQEGESWETDNCEGCKCFASGAFTCCGYGFHAGSIGVGYGCDIHQYNCSSGIIVDDPDVIGDCEYEGIEINLKR